MRKENILCVLAATVIFFACISVACMDGQQQTPPSCTAQCIPETNSSYIDARGTAHIQRVVPVPPTVSPEAQKFIGRPLPGDPGNRGLNLWQDQDRAKKIFSALYPVHMEENKIAGVPVRIVTPVTMPKQNRNKVLINVNGGGFVGDGGSWTESIPIGYLTQTKVVAVLYRLMPKYPFSAAVDDTVAVYRELLKT
ncbi:MAG TPA: alpha/beta hydrolase fold domain-containing protein [Acidobacteriaceae bacterium]|nr:alpha/beta hydrolase fold domain-containing protein [Acidobacteriaceae bacterium]